MGDVIGDHLGAGRAVIDEDTRLDRPEAEDDFLSRQNVGQLGTAERAGRGVEIDVVLELV